MSEVKQLPPQFLQPLWLEIGACEFDIHEGEQA